MSIYACTRLTMAMLMFMRGMKDEPLIVDDDRTSLAGWKEDELSKHQFVCADRNLLLVGRGNSGSSEGCRLLFRCFVAFSRHMRPLPRWLARWLCRFPFRDDANLKVALLAA
jgi:hypothetical protein